MRPAPRSPRARPEPAVVRPAGRRGPALGRSGCLGRHLVRRGRSGRGRRGALAAADVQVAHSPCFGTNGGGVNGCHRTASPVRELGRCRTTGSPAADPWEGSANGRQHHCALRSCPAPASPSRRSARRTLRTRSSGWLAPRWRPASTCTCATRTRSLSPTVTRRCTSCCARRCSTSPTARRSCGRTG